MNSAKWKLVVGGLLIAGGLGWVGYESVTGPDAAYAQDVKQYLANPELSKGHGVRLDGIAAKGSWERGGNHHRFQLAEKTNLAQTVLVDFEGTMPDTFREEVMVVVAGKVGPDGVLHATEVLPQCASKYQGVPAGYKHEGKTTVPIYSSEVATPQPMKAGS